LKLKEEKMKKTQQVFNKSYYYILPTLERSWKDLDLINNVYLFTEDTKELYEFYIVCFAEDPLLTALPEFISSNYNTKTKEYVYRMRVPSKYEEDYLLFLLGKYSLFTEEYKKTIFKMLGRSYKQSNIYKVIQKDQKLKEELEKLVGQKLTEEAELSSIYDVNKETYKYDGGKKV